jgi:hypothetical protein
MILIYQIKISFLVFGIIDFKILVAYGNLREGFPVHNEPPRRRKIEVRSDRDFLVILLLLNLTSPMYDIVRIRIVLARYCIGSKYYKREHI